MDNEKQADNIISIKREVDSIDDKIEKNKNDIKKLGDIQDTVVSLNHSISRCIDLLSMSVKGGSSTKLFNAMYEDNIKNYYSFLDNIEGKVDVLRKNINDLVKEKEAKLKEHNIDGEEKKDNNKDVK